MANKKIMLSKKELLVAASAAMTLGLGTTLGHEAVVRADTVNDTSSVTTSSQTTANTANPGAATSGTTSAASTTSNANTSTNNTTAAKTADQTSTTSTGTSATTTTNPVASTPTTSGTTQTAPITALVTTTPVTNAASTPVVAPVTKTQAGTSTTPVATTQTSATSATAQASPVATATTTPVTPTTTVTPTTKAAPVMTSVDTSNNTVSSDSAYTSADDFTWSVNDDTNEASLTGTTSKLTGTTAISIPTQITVTPNGATTGKQYNVTSIGSNAFTGNKTITDVQINNGVTDIDDGAFAYTGVKNVDFTNNKTLTNIGNLAFVSDQIKTIDLPDSVKTIGDSAFIYDDALTSVTMPASLQTIGNQSFAEDSNLSDVDFSKVTNLTTIGDSAFSGDSSITGVDLSKDNSLTSIGNSAFMYDANSTEVKLPDSLQTIGEQAFLANTSLKDVAFGPSLTTIGKEAFTYDNDLTSADFSNAGKLTLIDNGAFEYAGLNGTLTLPSNLVTVGSQAFGGDHLTTLNANQGLETIGDAAFSYNDLKGDLVIPSTIQTIGGDAFIGNQLSGVSTDATSFALGTDAFSYNRITDVSAPNVKLGSMTYNVDPASDQYAAIFTDSDHNKLSDYFNVDIGGVTESAMNISNITNGVTYSNGQFNIPSGTTTFTFNWLLSPNPTTDKGYSGTYDVVLDDPAIKVVSSNIPAGNDWTPNDNFVSAVTPDGKDVSLNDITVTVTDPSGKPVNTVDTTMPGNYKVTYTYGDETNTVTVSVYKRSGTINLSGTQSTNYDGQDQTINDSNYTVALSDGTTYSLQNGDLSLNEPALNAGTYQVDLTPTGLTNISKQGQNSLYNWTVGNDNAEFIINKAPITITANNESKVAGTTDPTLTATVTMPSNIVNGDKPVYTLSRASGEDVGNYPITVNTNPTDNSNYAVTPVNGTFQITPATKTISGSNYTMHVGDTTPTAKEFNATATDENGQPEMVNVDLSKVDMKTPGTYDVILSTTDSQTKTVQLTVAADETSSSTGNSTTNTPSNTTDPTTTTDPTDPTTTTDPTDPTTTTDPTDPTTTTDPTDPTTTTDPTDPTTTTDSTDPTTTTDPTDPTTTTGPTDPTTTTGPTDPTTTTDPTDPTTTTDPTDPTTTTDPTDPTTTTDPTDPTTTTDPTDPKNPTNKPTTPSTSTDPNTTVESNSGKGNVIMSGEVYYVPSVQKKSAGVLVAPTNTSNKNSSYTPTYQESGVATFPQTGNASGTWMQVLGVIIGILTFGVIDIRKTRHQG